MPFIAQNPFSVLGATMRDDRRQILALAEQRSLQLDERLCREARAALTNPRSRLAAEVAWFPGISPRRLDQLFASLDSDPRSVLTEQNVPRLARVNLVAAAMEAHGKVISGPDTLIAWFTAEVEAVNGEEVLRDINEDRLVAGFPPADLTAVVSEMFSLRRRYADAVITLLDTLPPRALVAAMTLAAGAATRNGELPGPELLHDVVDAYDTRVRTFLEAEAGNITRLLTALREAASDGDPEIGELVAELGRVVQNWDDVAQPVQISMKARGLVHQPSREVAVGVRAAAVDLFNDHHLVGAATHITDLLQDVFAELPEMHEQLERDEEAIGQAVADRARAEEERLEWERSIQYEARIGSVFQDVLSVSAAGVTWRNRVYPLGSITRLRWGGVRHSVNGIPTGTTYTIGFGDRDDSEEVQLKRDEVFGNLVERLWLAVGSRLAIEMLESLRGGSEFVFANAKVTDYGVVLPKQRWLGRPEQVQLGWSDVHIWTQDGSFCVGSKTDPKVHASISYIAAWNTHILEHVIRVAFKQGADKLSDILT